MAVINSLHIIPDYLHIKDSLEICDKYGTHFEYNDFFDPVLLDDKEALTDRIQIYKSLHRSKDMDTLHGVFYDICVNSSDSQIAEISKRRMISSMDIASELHCRGVVFHTNLIPGFEPEFYLNGWLNSYGDFYKELAKTYQGIEIYVENMFDMKPDMLTRLMENTSCIDACFDISHSHIHVEKTMEDWIDSLCPYIKHLHINDNHGITDEHLSVGDGTIDWDRFFKLINQKLERNVSMLVEVKDTDKQVKSLEYMKSRGWI